MQHKPNKKAIGIFFFIGILTLILIMGKGLITKFMSKDYHMAVLYFDESTQGLRVGSPVVFYGVEVGKVVKIELEADSETFEFKIPVYVKLTPIRHAETEGWQAWKEWVGQDRHEAFKEMIAEGLRARLISQSYLTGQMMIEFYIDEKAPVKLVRTEKQQENDIVEIPTVLSASEKLSQGLGSIEFRNSFDRLDGILTTLDKQLPELLKALTKSAENLEKITKLVSNDTVDKTNMTLSDISAAMKSLKNLTDYLEQYPESIVKGKK